MKKLILSIWMAIVVATVCVSCTETSEATVTQVYQPLVSGMVHTWIEIQFNDGTKTSVVLPDDNKVWDEARKKVGKKVKVKKSKDKWHFSNFPK
jgi:hypothetical protein